MRFGLSGILCFSLGLFGLSASKLFGDKIWKLGFALWSWFSALDGLAQLMVFSCGTQLLKSYPTNTGAFSWIQLLVGLLMGLKEGMVFEGIVGTKKRDAICKTFDKNILNLRWFSTN